MTRATRLLLLLLLAISSEAPAPEGRELVLMRIGEVERNADSTSVFDLYRFCKRQELPADLIARARDALLGTLAVGRSDKYSHYQAAMGLDCLGEKSEAVQRAIVRGMKHYFNVTNGYYRKFDESEAEDIGAIKNPSPEIAAFVTELQRHSGNARGGIWGAQILVAWVKRDEGVKAWLDAARVLEGAVWSVEHWHTEIGRHERLSRTNRAETARGNFDEAQKSYRTFLSWWPAVAHTPPALSEEPEGEERRGVPPTPSDATPVTIASPKKEPATERILRNALSDHDLVIVSEAARHLLKLPALSFETVAVLDNVRLRTDIAADLREEIRGRLQGEVLKYIDDLDLLLDIDPTRVLSLPAARNVDSVTACLLFFAAARPTPPR